MNVATIVKSAVGTALLLLIIFALLWFGAWSFYLVFSLIDWIAEIGIVPMPPNRTEF